MRGQNGRFTESASPARSHAADDFDRRVGLVLDRVMRDFVRRVAKLEKDNQELYGQRGGDPAVRESQASSAPGGGSSYDDEQARDAIALAFADGQQNGISIEYDDAGNAFSFTNTDKGSAAVAAHVEAANPHGQYTTDEEVTSIAQALLEQHENDPAAHPQFLTQPEGDELYQPKMIITAVAGERIESARCVVIDVDDLVYHGQNTNIEHAGRVVAITIESADMGMPVRMMRSISISDAAIGVPSGRRMFLGLDGRMTSVSKRGIMAYHLGTVTPGGIVEFSPGTCVRRAANLGNPGAGGGAGNAYIEDGYIEDGYFING